VIMRSNTIDRPCRFFTTSRWHASSGHCRWRWIFVRDGVDAGCVCVLCRPSLYCLLLDAMR
jgi:hypothetical protein